MNRRSRPWGKGYIIKVVFPSPSCDIVYGDRFFSLIMLWQTLSHYAYRWTNSSYLYSREIMLFKLPRMGNARLKADTIFSDICCCFRFSSGFQSLYIYYIHYKLFRPSSSSLTSHFRGHLLKVKIPPHYLRGEDKYGRNTKTQIKPISAKVTPFYNKSGAL